MLARQPGETQSLFEQLLAELTDAAYRAALRQGLRGSFIDLELTLWRDLRQVLLDKWDGESRLHDQKEGRSHRESSWLTVGGDGILAGRR